MNHIVFQSKCQGYSHIKSDLECQDSTLVKKTEKYALPILLSLMGMEAQVISGVVEVHYLRRKPR